jgi:hypothetical protein
MKAQDIQYQNIPGERYRQGHTRGARRRSTSPQGTVATPASRAQESEAERFAAAVPDMPANVRRFFQAEEPFVSPRQLESAQDRLEHEARASFGG